ncbi:MAG: hypothetical protein JNL02_17190 [Saprospiraceae bacterium]|nr:hypothetical protein [Saprospiraceae bacterium]
MKKYLFAAYAALFFAALSMPACKDEHSHDDDQDTEAPVLTITSPAEGASYTGTLDIHLEVTDESLHEMSVKVTRDSDGSVVFEEEPTVHDEIEFHFEHLHTFTGLSGDTPMTLTVVVEDHSAHTTTKTVHFIAKP